MQRRKFLKGASAAGAGAMITSLGSGVALADEDDWQDRLGRDIPDGPDDVSVAQSEGGVVATSNDIATQVGVEVLENGGNAVDAAAALHLVLGVTEPDSTGLGGGGYMSYYNAEHKHVYFVDNQVRASRHAHPELLNTDDVYDRGLAAGVPGIVRGLDVALKRWGTRYFDELAQPAIDLSRNGHEIDRELSLRIHQTQDNLDEHARAVYLDENGDPLQPGDLLVNEKKADALELIAEHGSKAFYQGPIAEAAANYIQDLGGVTTEGDFNRYRVSVDAPSWFTYRGYRVATNPNNNGANTLAVALKILERFDLSEFDVRSAERYHLLSEAFRHADEESFEYFADPEHVDRPWQGTLSEEFNANKVAQISLEEMSPIASLNPWEYQPGGPYRTTGHSEGQPGEPGDPPGPEDIQSTNHFTVADAGGNILSSTSTLGVGWVGGKMVPEYGFMLNVTGSYFGEPGSVLEIESDKRPRSNMIPTVVFDGDEPILTVGSPGANVSAPLNVIVNILDHQMGLAEAVAEPRVDRTSWEDGIDEDDLEQLEEKGWNMASDWTDVGAVQTYNPGRGRGPTGTPRAAGDPRRDGTAGGVDDDQRGRPPGAPPGQ